MASVDLINDFIEKPYPLWNNELTAKLVSEKLRKLMLPYSLTGCILKDMTVREKTLSLIPGSIKLVLASDDLDSFYKDRGLKPLPLNDSYYNAIAQVKSALNVFTEVPELQIFISNIVDSIQLLKAEDPETDISYSHPDVPFSIFVSVCDEKSMITNLRMAESILHEAMHLLLTLIEDIVPMVESNSNEIYYSPWREEYRPIRGVLHGAFVFKAISDFYHLLISMTTDAHVMKYLTQRQEQISKKLQMLKNFHHSRGLSASGRLLAFILI